MAKVIATSRPGGDFVLVDPGTHPANLRAVADLGQQESNYKGEARVRHEIYLDFEVVGDRREYDSANGPVSVRKTIWVICTASTHEKSKLRGIIDGIRGVTMTQAEAADFDVTSLLGKACQIQVGHRESNGKIYANILATIPLMKDMSVPEPELPLLSYSPADHTDEEYEALPEWIRKKIANRINKNVRGNVSSARQSASAQSDIEKLNTVYGSDDEFHDDIPF